MRPALRVPVAGAFPTSAAAYQKMKVGDARTLAADNGEAVGLLDRLAKARALKVELVDEG